MFLVSSTVRKHAKREQITYVEKSTHKLHRELIMNVIYENGQMTRKQDGSPTVLFKICPFLDESSHTDQ